MGEGEAAFYRRKGRFSKKFCRNFKEKKQADTAAGYSRTTLYRKLGEMRSAGAGALAALAQGEVEGGHLQSGGVAWEAVLDGTRRQRGRRGAAAPRGEQRVGPGVRGPRAVRAGPALARLGELAGPGHEAGRAGGRRGPGPRAHGADRACRCGCRDRSCCTAVLPHLLDRRHGAVLQAGVPPGRPRPPGDPVLQRRVPRAAPDTALAVALGLGLAAYDTGHSNFSVNNVEAVLLASLFIENVGLSSYRTALVLLGGLLVYDAFWVFGSKAALTFLLGSNSMLIPEKGSVMLDVAAGSSIVNVPTKLIFPKLAAGSSKLGFSLLGLGDIVVPGLLVAFALNLEAEAGRKETGGGGDAKPTKYFAWTMLAYAVGLGATFCANSVFRSAQPALVYLSPATISVLYLVAKLRNEEDVLFGYKREGRGAAGGGGR